MRKSNLRYYVELVPGDEKYRTYLNTKGKHYDHRFELEIDKGPKFMLNGVWFNIGQVVAEPTKKNVLKEVVLCVIAVLLILFVFPCGSYEYNTLRWIGAIVMAAGLGSLLGKLNIDLQKEQAHSFNMS